MSKFKIGDKVKCIDGERYLYINENEIYTILKVEGDKIILEGINTGYAYETDYFRLVKEVNKNMNNNVNHPSHYTKGIEAIDYIESWDMNFNVGNAIKYITRAPYKSNQKEDLEKALWYIQREIDRISCKEEQQMIL